MLRDFEGCLFEYYSVQRSAIHATLLTERRGLRGGLVWGILIFFEGVWMAEIKNLKRNID